MFFTKCNDISYTAYYTLHLPLDTYVLQKWFLLCHDIQYHKISRLCHQFYFTLVLDDLHWFISQQ